MPITGDMTGHLGMDEYQSEFSHDDEVVQPGYHKVVLKKYGITAELTSTDRVGFHRYAYPSTKDAYVLFDIGAYLAHSATVKSEVQKISDQEIAGMSVMKGTSRRKKDTPVYFVAQFNQPTTGFGGWEQGKLIDSDELPDSNASSDPAVAIGGKDAGAFVRFETSAAKPVLMKVGISFVSVEGARKYIDAELPGWDFDGVVSNSKSDWNEHLSRIKVEGGSAAQRMKFYTDIWRSMLGRRIFSDADGAYSDMTGKDRVVRQIQAGEDGKPSFTMHNFDAWWGSHWSLDVLWPLLCPDRYSDFCNTSVEMYKNGGLIPRGPSGGNYTFVMIGDTAAPAITSAYAKGIRDFDCETALAGLVHNTEADGGRYYGGYARKPTAATQDEYVKKGYVSWGKPLGGFMEKRSPV
jgi:predicted alpha-1,2-mannosidase